MGETNSRLTKPKVSICLTTYKRASVLPLSVESILSQTFTDFELIINDDCSPDNTESVCRAFMARDSRIQYFRNATNLKMPGNLNAAISHARGDYIANLHDGDVYRPDLIEKWASALDRYPTAGFVFNSLEALNQDRVHLKYFWHDYPPLIRGRDLLDEMLWIWNSPVFGTTMVRRAAYDQVGPFDKEFGFISDIDMWMRLSLYYDVAYIREPLISVTPHEADHPYSFLSWELNLINDQLHRKNLARRYANMPKQYASKMARLRRSRDSYWLWNLILCAKHHRWDKVAQGLEFFRVSDSLFLRAIARVGIPFGHSLGVKK